MKSHGVFALFLLIACNKEKNSGPPEAQARSVYENRCVACHGARGHGDGPSAASLIPQPRDFSNAAWQKSVTDDHIRTIILNGGSSVGRSALMPANSDLASRTAVVDALVQMIRAFPNQ